MTQFAYFNPAASDPRPVLGWYDTGALTYPNLPAANSLLTLTQAQWDNRFATPYLSGGVPVAAPPPPAPTPAQQAYALMMGGLAITSTGTAALDATYPSDPATQSKAAAIEVRLAAGLGFPGGLTELPWKDSAGAWHLLTQAQFASVASAISSFVAACDLVIDGYPGAALPAAAATIP